MGLRLRIRVGLLFKPLQTDLVEICLHKSRAASALPQKWISTVRGCDTKGSSSQTWHVELTLIVMFYSGNLPKRGYEYGKSWKKLATFDRIFNSKIEACQFCENGAYSK